VVSLLGAGHDDIRDKLIRGFLNKWRSRFPNNSESGSAILSTISRLSPYLQKLIGCDIESVNFDDNIHTKDVEDTIFNCVTCIFNAVANCYGFRTTVGAKILGIINPNLFVIWDNEIAYHYGLKLFKDSPGNIYSGEGYVTFLKEMQRIARLFLSDYQNRFGKRDLTEFLSLRLHLNPIMPLAKFIDEFNWITITKKIEIPPKWHPCDDKVDLT